MKMDSLPVILFVLDEHLHVKAMSNLAKELLGSASLNSIIDPDSKMKWHTYCQNKKPRSGEIHLATDEHKVPHLYKIFYNYNLSERQHYVVFIPSQEDIRKVRIQLNELRHQLMDSDYDSIKTSERKHWISKLEPFMSTSDISSLLVEEKRIDRAVDKLQRMEDLLRTIRPDMIELGKWETVDLIMDELHDVRSIISYYQTLINLPDIS